MITRAVSETGSNNNNSNKLVVKKLQPIEEAVVVREKPLFEFIQEFPSQCAIQWPMHNEEKVNFSCWSEFCGYAKVFIRSEVPRLIQLLTPPLLIRPDEKFLYQSAKHFWDKFSLPQSQGPYSVILRSESNTLLGESLEPLLNSDRKQDWSWQRKLVFLLVCVFSSKKFTSMQSSSTEMDPKLSGIVLALLDKIKGPSRGFLPVFSNTHKYKSQLLGSIVHYWEMHYRSKCGGMEIRNPLLNRYPKQEKLYFLLLANNFLLYYKPQSKEWNHTNCILGLLRMMFSVQFTFNEDAAAMDWFPVQQLQQLQPSPLTQDLEALFYNAKTINRLIKSNDVTIQWLTEEHKRKDLLKETLDLLTVLPLNSSYVQGVSNAFHTLNKPLPLVPHATRFLQAAELKDKLFACLDLQLWFQIQMQIPYHLQKNNMLYLLIENQIAQPVHEYYTKMMNLVMNQTGDLPLLVADIMDPELQRHCTLVVIPNSSYYFIQALSWARWVFVTYSNSYHNNQLPLELKSLYALLLGFCTQEQSIQLLIGVLRILLLGHSVEKVAADMEQVAKHAEMATSLFQKNLYQAPKKDSANLHSMFEQNDRVCLIRQLPEFAQYTVIIVLLLPWLQLDSSVMKIPKRNHIFLKKILTHWGKNKTSDDTLIQQTKTEVSKILYDLSFEFPTVRFKNDEIKEELLEDLPKQSTAGLGSVEDLTALLDIASKSNVPSLRLMAMIGCLVPILPVTREYFNALFDASTDDITNDYTEYAEAHHVKWVKSNSPGQGFCSDELIHELCNIHSNRNSFFFIQTGFIGNRVPKLHKFQQAVLPVYTHNGELMNPLFTSFLQTVPERKHSDDNVALKNQLQDKGRNKRRATQQMIPELNLNAILETTTTTLSTDTPPTSSAIELYSPSSPMIEG